MKNTQAITFLCVALLLTQPPYAFPQQPQPQPAPGQAQTMLSEGQLESLVAPIALYPDPILSQTLVASTYPLDVVSAGRWLKQNSQLSGKALADAVATQPWDASVQALVMLPDVLNRLDQNVGWMSDLGNAFLAQEQDVMNAVQVLRQRASAAGMLKTTSQQTVTTTTENGHTFIVIQPANPEVVYVPVYNPVAVWGPAPAYYPWPSMYYPPYAGVAAAGVIGFGAGLAVGAFWGGGWGGWGWGPSWGGGNVIINNNFINRNRFNRVNTAGGNRWVHNPARGGPRPGVGNIGRGGAPGVGRGNFGPGAGRGPGQGNIGQGGRGPGMGPGAGRGPGQGNIGQGGRGPGMGPGAGRGPGQGNVGQGGRGAFQPGQGAAGRLGPGFNPGNAGRPAAIPNRGSANRVMGGAPFGGGFRGGGFNRGGGFGGFRGGGGGFRGGGGGFRGGGGGFRGGGGMRGGGRRR